MNPKDCDDYGHSILGKHDAMDAYEAVIDRLQREETQKKLAESKARSQAANKALNDLCDALGVEITSVSINSGTGMLHIPAEQVQMVANRIKAMNAANVLIEGAL